jgi:hypothetical protein
MQNADLKRSLLIVDELGVLPVDACKGLPQVCGDQLFLGRRATRKTVGNESPAFQVVQANSINPLFDAFDFAVSIPTF